MEPLSIVPLTLASVLASFSADNVEAPVINTHISPEIVGLWELDLQATPNFAMPDNLHGQKSNGQKTNGHKLNSDNAEIEGEEGYDQDLEDLIAAIKESNQLSQDVEQTTDNSSNALPTYMGHLDPSDKSPSSNSVNSVDVQQDAALTAQVAQVIDCKERYNFQADNVLFTTSGAEWTYGQYLYQHQPDGLPILAINTSYDNNKMDCSGRQIDQKGDAMFAYVDYQPQTNTMRWCIDDQGDKCFMTFRRLLP